ncbi:MAG: hypothetical protein GQ564_17885 [Bacteroidales bacterium]|nr:hypothetical protein [Bacteroidales bacterium]
MNQRNLRNVGVLFFWIILFCTNGYAKENSLNSFPRTILEFYILESEFSEGKYLDGNINDYNFTKYDNKDISKDRPINDRMITLRSRFKIDSSFSNQSIYLVTLPIDYPCSIYINGKLLAYRGSYKYIYTNRIHFSEKFLIPSDKINYNDINEIAFQLYPQEGESYPFCEVFITNFNDASAYVFYRNLMGPNLMFGLALCSFVFFVFYLIIYISRREFQKQQFLFFAFMNLFFVVCYNNNIFTFNFSHTFLLEKISRAGFPLFMFVAICFLLEYTGVFKKKKIIKAALILIYLPAIILVLTPNTTTEVIEAYNGYPLVVLIIGNFILFTIALLYYLKEKSIKSGFLFLIFFLNIFAGIYDGYYFAILKIKPFLLLIPNAVFGINLVIFFILATDHSKLYHIAIKSSEKLGKMNQELELLVEKRTKKTQEYANKLEEANNTKDKFFSIIAHDMKNPFNTLIGYSDILKTDFREFSEDEIYQQLNIIYNTSVKGYNLLENLLQWSQTQTNKIIFEPIKINLYKIIQDCINDIENQSQFKDIDINNDVSENYHIIADKNLLNTIIRNLINNAIKYTPRNGMVTISSKKDNLETLISVKDTGIGMSETELQSLFQIDKIYSKPGTNQEKGSGLGLILCKEFVEKHGGRLWVESELEIGSVFKFSIPKIVEMN